MQILSDQFCVTCENPWKMEYIFLKLILNLCLIRFHYRYLTENFIKNFVESRHEVDFAVDQVALFYHPHSLHGKQNEKCKLAKVFETLT